MRRREKSEQFSYRIARGIYRASQKTPDQICLSLHSSPQGLSHEDVEKKRARYGVNEIASRSGTSALHFLLKAFRNPFNYLILTLAVVSYATDDLRAAIVMATMVVLSVALTFFQELRSSRAAEGLSAMVQSFATVSRKDTKDRTQIALADLVPGDITHFSAGDLVPADIRLLNAKNLMVNQSAMTGETMPVEKSAGIEDVTNKQLPELKNICLMGSSIVSGSASGIVVHTGARTYLGSIAKTITGMRVETSFDQGIHRFTQLMLKFILFMVPTVFIINGLTKGNWSEAFLFAVAIAVGLTPELLPMIVTVNLAKGALRMSKKKVIVKRLNSIQNFGAMDVLCTDKTGTLTEDQLEFGGAFDAQGKPNDQVLKYAYLNSRFQTGLKNFLDIALIQFAESERGQLSETARDYQLIDELPFDFVRKRMSVLLEHQAGQRVLICKGAIEEVLAVCGETQDLRERYLSVGKSLSDRGLRVIALATKPMGDHQNHCELPDEAGLSFLGYVGFLDPPVKDSARAAIEGLARYGVSVKILTGDNERVTASVAKKVGLDGENFLLGHQIALMSEAELGLKCEGVSVFAKLTPDQKQRVIQALQKNGHVVGFIGDGINDAPGLRTADVGISVNNAVDIAKESADIILLEKSLLVLEEGVLEGRKVFGNIIKYIKMGASSNFGNVFSMLGASVLLPFLPMLPVQMLTQNLLYDFSQTGIPLDRVDEEYLNVPRKWDIGDIKKFMLYFGPVSSVFDYATFAVLWFVFKANSVATQGFFQSGWFVEGLLSQTLIVHLIRTKKIPFLQSRASNALLITTALVMAAGIGLPFSALGKSLGFVHLPSLYFAWLLLILFGYCVLAQLMKSWFIRRYGFQ